MKKMWKWLGQSNRWKHLTGGFIVGLLAFSVYGAIYSGCVAAGCLELKDKLGHGYWDWIDFLLTVIGSMLAALILYFVL